MVRLDVGSDMRYGISSAFGAIDLTTRRAVSMVGFVLTEIRLD